MLSLSVHASSSVTACQSYSVSVYGSGCFENIGVDPYSSVLGKAIILMNPTLCSDHLSRSLSHQCFAALLMTRTSCTVRTMF